MSKYRVYGNVSATVYLGEYEADSEEEAEEKAEANVEANWSPTLCNQCAGELEVSDVYKVTIEKAE